MLLPSCGLLAPTKTHAERRWLYLPNIDMTTPGIGVLTIVQGRRDVASYALDLARARDGRTSVVFLRQGTRHAEAARVTLGSEKAGRCTCDGFRFNGTCKHADAVLSMVAALVLTVPAVEAIVA